jgi:hypothetical protein
MAWTSPERSMVSISRTPWGASQESVKANDLIIPNTLAEKEITTFLDDVFHELSGPGQSVELLP